MKGTRVGKRSLAVIAVLALLGFDDGASAAIRMKRIYFNPPGADTGSNRSLNKEYVVIKNTGSKKRSLDGWKLLDKGADHRYRFPDIILAPGDYARVHTGRGDDSGATGCNGDCVTFFDLYWDLKHYVWNNDGDVAKLKKPSGVVADRCGYGEGAESPKRC